MNLHVIRRVRNNVLHKIPHLDTRHLKGVHLMQHKCYLGCVETANKHKLM